MDVIVRALKAISRSKKLATTPDMSPEHSDDSDFDITPTSQRDRDLLAFRTIITMLALLQSPNTEPAKDTKPTSTEKAQRNELRVLDALSAILVRQHEVAAVMAKPYDGDILQVLASVIHSNHTEHLPSFAQPSAARDDQGVWNRVLHYLVAPNPRDQRVNNHKDSLTNWTDYPTITNPAESVLKDLSAAADKNMSLLEIFLEHHWWVFW